MGNIFDEEDLKSIFSPAKPPEPIKPLPEVRVELEPPKPKEPEKVYKPEKFNFALAVKFLSLFIGIFIFSYLMINFNAIKDKFNYFYDVNLKKTTYSKAVATPTPDPFDASSEARLVIPKIGVDAPIIWNVPEDQLKEKLLEGITHSEGTALPGSVGNIFLTGHSSYYAWVSSPYKDVFALLDKVSVNDEIFIKYSSKIFTYNVIDTKVVSPNDTSVMDQSNANILSLMTCVPVGTNLNRLIVVAEQS